MESVKIKRKLRFKMALVILSILFLMSLCALIARGIFLQHQADSATVVVPHNFLGQSATATDVETPGDLVEMQTESSDQITELSLPMHSLRIGDRVGNDQRILPLEGVVETNTTASLLEFYRWQDEYNKKFEVINMLPGDVETRYFCVCAHHTDEVTLVFQAEVTEQTRNLGDVLDVVVTNTVTNTEICRGTFNEINGAEFKQALPKNTAEETVMYYRVDVSMDTSVDNPYQVAHLLADFNWYIEEDDRLTPPPQTGDPFQITLYVVLAGSALSILILLFFAKRKKDDEEEGQNE